MRCSTEYGLKSQDQVQKATAAINITASRAVLWPEIKAENVVMYYLHGGQYRGPAPFFSSPQYLGSDAGGVTSISVTNQRGTL